MSFRDRQFFFKKKVGNLVFLYKMRTKFCTPQSQQKNCVLYACEYGIYVKDSIW